MPRVGIMFRKYIRLVFTVLVLAVGVFLMLFSMRKSDMPYKLDPSLKLQQFGLVSEDGVMQVGIIEKNRESDYSASKQMDKEKVKSERPSVEKFREGFRQKNMNKKIRKSRKQLKHDASNKEQFKELNEYKRKIRGNTGRRNRNAA